MFVKSKSPTAYQFLAMLVPAICIGLGINAARGVTLHDKIIGTLASPKASLEAKVEALGNCPYNLAEEAYKTVSSTSDGDDGPGNLLLRAIAARGYANKCAVSYEIQKETDLIAESDKLYDQAYSENKHHEPIIDLEYGKYVMEWRPYYSSLDASGKAYGRIKNGGLEIARKAVEAEPKWAFGHATLAYMYMRSATRRDTLHPTLEPSAAANALHRAEIEATTAIRLHDMPGYHTTLAAIFMDEHRYSDMKREVLRAIKGGDNGSEVHLLLCIEYRHENKLADSKREGDIAQSMSNQGL